MVNVSDEDAFIMSLAENIARRGHRPLEILADIELLLARDYTIEDIIQRTGLSQKYVRDIVFLLEKGEERLIEAVQNNTIPLTAALEIARAKNDDGDLGDMLEEAYKTGQLKGHQLTDAKRLMEKRREKGPKSCARPKLPNSAHSLVQTYQKEVARQHKMVLKAEHAHQQLLLVVQGLKTLFADENFVTLLRAEGLDTLPKYLGASMREIAQRRYTWETVGSAYFELVESL